MISYVLVSEDFFIEAFAGAVRNDGSIVDVPVTFHRPNPQLFRWVKIYALSEP